MTFEINELDAEIKLGAEGDDFTLHLNGQEFETLPPFKDVGEVPIVGYSETEDHHGANTQRRDFLIFLKGKRNPVSVEHNMRSGFVSLDVCGKP